MPNCNVAWHVSGSAFCWDCVSLSRQWDACPLGLGLVVELLNFHICTLQSRLTGKRPMSYVDDDDSDIEGGGGEVTFTGTSRSKKAKVSDTTFDMVDVSPHCVVVIVVDTI